MLPAGEYARYAFPVVIFRDIVEHRELSEIKEQWILLLASRTERTNPGDLRSQGKPRGQR